MHRFLAPLLALLAALLTASTAHAQDPVGDAAKALRDRPVYVHPDVRGQMSVDQANALAARIKDEDSPVFVAVLPADSGVAARDVLPNLRSRTGIAGVYAVRLGAGFGAAADDRVLSARAVDNLRRAAVGAHPGDATGQLVTFADDAAGQAGGSAPSGWRDSTGIGGTGALTVGVVLLLLVGAVLFVRQRARLRDAERARTELARLRTVVDEDITAYGEAMARIAFDPADPAADDAMRADYQKALDAYEKAKSRMDAAGAPGDVRGVTEALEEGRFALATLEARRTGAALPERRPPCFFDPRHGPSTADVKWTPPGSAARTVPACTADANLLAAGEEPMVRTVHTARGPQPYWNAGPAYAPWAGGYFGGGLLPGLLVGTMLGQAVYAAGGWAAADGMGEGGHAEGPAGADFDPGDFGGGFGGGHFGDGGFGGGGFGDGGFGGF
ncbi:membrane protein [Streptomyces sp. CNQ-509]|uniref:hypothetical protein n=1 Tax=unclassified Streptomyces TaxID=2593676 RepID=UPI00062DCAA1|nr:hypothetical protein [Streptomyces sp. CNQ-509]AKH82531.1 membrane protein [Streptomyces sp. CNQ-509]